MKNQGAHILKWGVHILKKKHVFISLRWLPELREFLRYKKDHYIYKKTSIFSKVFIFLNEKSRRYTHQNI